MASITSPGSFLAAFCLLTLATVNAQGKDLYGNLVTTAHYHSLGKLMLAFVAFWAYIAFSQFLLIWIANLPEEATWYHVRIFGGWRPVSIALFFIQFLIPVRHPALAQPQAAAAQAGGDGRVPARSSTAVDLYWLIWPAYNEQQPDLPLDAHHRLRRRGRHLRGLRPVPRPRPVHGAGEGSVHR